MRWQLLRTRSLNFITWEVVIPGKLAKLTRPGIQEIQRTWIFAFSGMTIEAL